MEPTWQTVFDSHEEEKCRDCLKKCPYPDVLGWWVETDPIQWPASLYQNKIPLYSVGKYADWRASKICPLESPTTQADAGVCVPAPLDASLLGTLEVVKDVLTNQRRLGKMPASVVNAPSNVGHDEMVVDGS